MDYLPLIIFGVVIVLVLLIVSVKQVEEYERGLKFSRGKFIKSRMAYYITNFPII